MIQTQMEAKMTAQSRPYFLTQDLELSFFMKKKVTNDDEIDVKVMQKDTEEELDELIQKMGITKPIPLDEKQSTPDEDSTKTP